MLPRTLRVTRVADLIGTPAVSSLLTAQEDGDIQEIPVTPRKPAFGMRWTCKF